MSIVEKAAEKLKSLQPEPALPPPADDPAPLHTGPTIERLHGRVAALDGAVADITSPWHVDPHALRRAGLLPADDDAAARLADEIRRVKRPLLENVNGKRAMTLAHSERIVVTSAVPGEGKTFTAVNLALSFAREPDFEVVLVDADIPKSDVTRVLGLADRPGLIDTLTGERGQPADVIVHTDVPNLLVIPAGKRSAVTTELFGGRRMEHVLDQLTDNGRQRLVVFDSSPLLATPESQVLASHMGQVLMVVAAGRTRQHELKAALEAFKEAQYVGLLLNMSRLPAIETHHYGNYSQYGGYGLQGD